VIDRIGRLAAVLAVAALGGCAAAPRLDLPPTPVAAVPTGPAPVSRLHTEIVVRAFVEAPDGLREVGGADCLLETEAFEAAFRSPGRVVVPILATRAPALVVTCRADGRQGTVQQPLLRRWVHDVPPGWGSWRDYPFGSPWGPGYGGWIGDPVWRGGWYGPGPYAVFYPDIRVRMR
jgi:hypothetical protein